MIKSLRPRALPVSLGPHHAFHIKWHSLFLAPYVPCQNLERVGRQENVKEIRRWEHKRDGQGTRLRPRIDSSGSRRKPNARRQASSRNRNHSHRSIWWRRAQLPSIPHAIHFGGEG
ncbi:hypothetical protein GALMADRAFT_273206 [Galerina marginata CBS 339.88]|uniref:Uncharacterized protein n=1 Tax=Galerina marginata (strain CBS 339.88) TaxID=685588 RepID=A0A067SKR7_GALM3|nr:hypothetical protein GALMADRAFT_273206 [Galerina marginata CBS 339.88]